jgi:hypothetical protein
MTQTPRRHGMSRAYYDYNARMKERFPSRDLSVGSTGCTLRYVESFPRIAPPPGVLLPAPRR